MQKSSLVKLLATLPLALSAASIQQASAYSDEFMQWKEQTLSSYQQYKDERDQAFTDFLKKQWKEVDTKDGEVRDEEPKPVDMPVAEPVEVIVEDLPIVSLPERKEPNVKPPIIKPPLEAPVIETPVIEQPLNETPIAEAPLIEEPEIPHTKEPEAPFFDDEPIFSAPIEDTPIIETPTIETPIAEKPITEAPQPEEPMVEAPKTDIPPIIVPPKVEPKEPAPKQYSGKEYRFNFFGRETSVYADRALAKRLSSRYNGESIAKGWSDLSLSDYEPVLEQLEIIGNQYSLGDWGKVQLVFALSKAMHPSNVNNQTFTSWFLLIKQDYQARLAYNNKGVYLLVPAQQSLYEVTFFTFGGKRFYAVSPDGKPRDLGSVFTYDGEYPRAIEPVNMKDPLAFSDEQHYQQRSFKFKFQKTKYDVSLNVNPARVNYLASYPQMDIDEYFISPVDSVTTNDALDHFRPMLDGKSELEAVNLLLRFVQTGFEYQTDDQQFGFENYLFAEETLTMPASDCEDRSVLFAWLVRELLGLEVVGLDYPGHIAAAVAFSKPVPGDSITWNGKQFTVTDPTYINANAGMTMPEVAQHKPKVVAIQ